MERQFTATVYILHQDRTLLIKHRKHGRWLPPGGHIDPNETPTEAAKREVWEETGLEIEFIQQENVWINSWNANSFERPYMCLLENIPANKNHPAHQHVDMIYVASPLHLEISENPQETSGIHWFKLDEIEQLDPDVEIFAETQQVIRGLLSQNMLVP